MKFLVFLLMIILPAELFSQALAFRDFMIAASSNTNPKLLAEGFKAFGGKDRFVSEKWLNGAIFSTGGEVVSENYKFNYDYLENEVYLKSNKSEQIITVLNNTIKRFYLIDDKSGDTSQFVKFIGIDAKNKQFFQLVGGEHTQVAGLLKYKTVEKVKANKNSYLNNFNGTYDDTYKEIIKYYYVSKPKGITPMDKLIRKSFTDVFPYLKDSANLLVRKPNLTEAQAKVLLNFLNNNGH